MKLYKYQILITAVFIVSTALMFFSNVNRENVVYVSQFLILATAIWNTKDSRTLNISFACLLFADLIYYVLVYKFQYGTADKSVVIFSSFLYLLSFILFAYNLLKNNWRKFLRVAFSRSQIPIVLFFIGVAGYYIFIPGLEKLVEHGPSFGHVSNLVTLLSSLPLVIITYVFLTNGLPGKPQLAIIGFFVLGILDIGIQLETIKYGDLKFSLYDILWFTGVYFISLSAKDFSQSSPKILEKRSVENLIKKTFFISALVPMLAFYFITIDIFNFSPMYFIFVVVSIFLFGIGVSKIIHHRLARYNQGMQKILLNEIDANLDTIIGSSPIEFHQTLLSVYNRVIEKDINELNGQKNNYLEMQNLFRKTAHDLASPLSVLEILSRTPGEFDADRKSLLSQATNRVRKIADDILLKGKSTTFQDNRMLHTIKSCDLSQRVKNLILEKKIEFKNHRKMIHLAFNTNLTTDRKIIAAEEDLIRVISNLINNSAEAISDINGVIKISLKENPEYFEIQIQDDGPGFPYEVLQNGLTSSISMSKATGHGIGLISAKQIVQKWLGSIDIQNDEGAKVTIHLKMCDDPIHRNTLQHSIGIAH